MSSLHHLAPVAWISRSRKFRPLLGVTLLASLASCGAAADTSSTGETASLNFTSPYVELDLATPAELTAPPTGTGVGGIAAGASFSTGTGGENVSAQDNRGRFLPNFATTTKFSQARLAAATYWLDMTDKEAATAIILDWIDQPQAENTWVGLANWDLNRWVWRKLEDVERRPVPNMASFIRDADKMLACTILVLGTSPVILDQAGTDVGTGAPPPPEGLLHANSHLGINLGTVNDWSPATPFVDVFKTARPWIPQDVAPGGDWDNGHAIATDENGWVTSLDAGQAVATLMMTRGEGIYPAGEYLCLYEGEGTIEFQASATEVWAEAGRIGVNITPSASGHARLRITSTNPANYIRNIRLIMPGYEENYDTLVFSPDFLSTLSGFEVLRFMDWGATNHSEVITWDDRTTPNSYTQMRHLGEDDAGVALEYMVDLANANLSDAWICIPTKANDNYVVNAAALIRDRLDPRLRVFVEYSNEVWNGAFPASNYARDQGVALGLSTDPNQAKLRFYSQRGQEIMTIFTTAFEGQTERLVRVAAGQSANPWTGTTILDWSAAEGAPNENNVADRFDVYAVAPYFGGYLGNNPEALTTVDMTVEEVLLACDADSASVNGPGGNTETNASNTTSRGIKLIAYEGGQHLVGVGTAKDVEALTDLFIATNRAAGMRQTYEADLNRWTTSGGGLFMAFAHLDVYSKHGSWGILEAQNQSTATAPKWLGLMDWLATVNAAAE